MSRTLALSLACVAALTVVPRLAGADTIYETVDALEARSATTIQITGVVAGASGPTTKIFFVGSQTGTDRTARCERLALLAMAKPGKFQLVMLGDDNSTVTCRLQVRTP